MVGSIIRNIIDMAVGVGVAGLMGRVVAVIAIRDLSVRDGFQEGSGITVGRGEGVVDWFRHGFDGWNSSSMVQ